MPAWDAKEAGARFESRLEQGIRRLRAKYPQEAAEFTRRSGKQLPADWKEKAKAIIAGA